MSKELIGSNREVVGSPAYLEKLHNAHFDGTLRCSRGDDFARSLESLAGNRFCPRFKPNLERIVRELERDLEQGARDNDYIRDENADNLRAALKQLERCGVRCYSLERKVDDLDWFVGGDPDKIHELQRLINATGMTVRLKEDGVYGPKTQEAEEQIEKSIAADFAAFLLNPAAVKYAKRRISLGLTLFIAIPGRGAVDRAARLLKLLFDNRQTLERFIWKMGVEHYLRPRGYDVAALLLEHSLEKAPHNMYFSESHWVTRKFMQTKGFQDHYSELKKNICRDPQKFAVPGFFEINFQKTGDMDFYYGIGRCTVTYTCEKRTKKSQFDSKQKTSIILTKSEHLAAI